MASTAQDPHAPLRGAAVGAGGEKAKDEDLEDGAFRFRLKARSSTGHLHLFAFRTRNTFNL